MTVSLVSPIETQGGEGPYRSSGRSSSTTRPPLHVVDGGMTTAALVEGHLVRKEARLAAMSSMMRRHTVAIVIEAVGPAAMVLSCRSDALDARATALEAAAAAAALRPTDADAPVGWTRFAIHLPPVPGRASVARGVTAAAQGTDRSARVWAVDDAEAARLTWAGATTPGARAVAFRVDVDGADAGEPFAADLAAASADAALSRLAGPAVHARVGPATFLLVAPPSHAEGLAAEGCRALRSLGLVPLAAILPTGGTRDSLAAKLEAGLRTG